MPGILHQVKKKINFVLIFTFVLAIFAAIILFTPQGRMLTGFVVSEVVVIDVSPTAPNLTFPENNSAIFNETITYVWNNSIDDNGDALTYNLMVFRILNETDEQIIINETGINETPVQTNNTPDAAYILSDYYWKARAFDNFSYSNWSETWKFRFCRQNHNPAIRPIGSLQVKESTIFNYTVGATDADGDAITFSDNTLLFDINSTTGLIYFNATPPGFFIITIVAFDGCNATHEIMMLTILSKNASGGQTPEEKNATPASGASASGAAPEKKKNESEKQKPVQQLTREEAAMFTKAEIIYIGDFKYQNLFNVTMYEGPIWFFTYKNTNYFLTATSVSDMLFIGFFNGPGFLFREPSIVFIDLNNDGTSDISLAYLFSKDGKYQIILESLKQPGTELPSAILQASIWLLFALLVIGLILFFYMFVKNFLKEQKKHRDPLKITKSIQKSKEGYAVQIKVNNIGDARLEKLVVLENVAKNAELTKEVKCEKKLSETPEKKIEGKIIMVKMEEFPPKEQLVITYGLKAEKAPERPQGIVKYQIKILDTSVDFSKTYI